MSGESVSNATSLFPRHLVIQSDNTVAQAKHQYVAVFLAFWWCQGGCSCFANIMFIVVGHTHEGIDELLGVVVSLILQFGAFETIAEWSERLLEKLRTKFVVKQELVTYTCLFGSRDFSTWSSALQRAIWYCWANREGQEAPLPHAFMFKQGLDLGTLEKAWFGATGREEVAGGRSLSECEDVCCCVKTYMRDAMLQQAPALVLPSARQEQLVDEPRDVCVRHPLSNQKIQEWAKLEAKLRDYGMPRIVDALHKLVHDRLFSLPGLPWLRSGWTVDRADRGDSGNYVVPHSASLLMKVVCWR